jgi:hypothetical protein
LKLKSFRAMSVSSNCPWFWAEVTMGLICIPAWNKTPQFIVQQESSWKLKIDNLKIKFVFCDLLAL